MIFAYDDEESNKPIEEILASAHNNVVQFAYDAAGNLTKDNDGYECQYDYENRIVRITKDGNNAVVCVRKLYRRGFNDGGGVPRPERAERGLCP